MIPWHFSDSCFLDYSNITTNNLSSTLHLTQRRLSSCGYECLIWVLVGETVTLGFSNEMILCYDGQLITTNSSAEIYVVWRKKTDRHVDYLKLNLQVSQTLGTFRAHLPLDARLRQCNAKGIWMGHRNTNVHHSYTQAIKMNQSLCRGASKVGFKRLSRNRPRLI